MTPATLLIEAITAAKQAEATARLNRLAAVRAFAAHVRALMERLKLDRGTVTRRLCWESHTLGNVIHLDYCLPHDMMVDLADALGPKTAAERKAAKRQPKKKLP